nr:heparan sulfate 2-O-sulfotransferase 1-like isoform X1 [Ciona intestinalis]|eukprot:XP_009858624.1 heparan sulfate 2-O-sulfotransferase 1-like isoform X1 [Ciona intestinalis]
MRMLRHFIMTKHRNLVTCVALVGFLFIYVELRLSQLHKTEIKEVKSVQEPQRVNSPLGFYTETEKFDSNLPIILYNRVPKTGSTSFSNLVYDLTKTNKMYCLHLNITRNSLKIPIGDQYNLALNMTTWVERRPALYHGHFGYFSFAQFGFPDPMYINILREPLDRLLSFYYFIRYGDDFRKGLKRTKQGDKTTFDECVAQNGHDCQPRALWLQIPMMCGQSAECWKVGSQWALQQAKENLVNRYALVGVTEQLEDFVVVLEAIQPRIFNGIINKFRTGSKSHIRNTIHKEPPSEATLAAMKNTKTYRMEREFYDFAVRQFEHIKRYSTFKDETGTLQPLYGQYHYEKIFGPTGNMDRKH